MKTDFHVTAMMSNSFYVNGQEVRLSRKPKRKTSYQGALGAKEEVTTYIGHLYKSDIAQGETFSIQKFGGYVSDLNNDRSKLQQAASAVLKKAEALGFDKLLQLQKDAWAATWAMSNITIDGDVKAQQGIRFNIFHLNQTYSGQDYRLNIGPKGFTGEKYGGSTYWDTEAYCIPFYMATKDQEVARNLLKYRYNQLDKAIENAEKLGFSGGAALYPMVTINSEECHNEWEITYEEIHRNGAIAHAIFNYTTYTGDKKYLAEYGLDVLIGIARFWAQRVNWSTNHNKYVMLGVTGPNEFENNVNNNWYSNYLANWCLRYTIESINYVKENNAADYRRIIDKDASPDADTEKWKHIIDNTYIPTHLNDEGSVITQTSFYDN